MKKTITLFFFLLCFAFATSAQTTVATGLSKPIGLALKGSDLYVSEFDGDKISKIDLTQMLPTSATTALGGVEKPTGLLVVGDYLYFNTEFDIPAAGETKTGRINLSNPTVIEQVLTTNIGVGHQAFAVDGNFLYISSTGGIAVDEGIYKIDMTGALPQAPIAVITGFGVSGMALRGNDLYYGYFLGTEVFKIDITQPTPIPTTVISGLQGPDGLTFKGDSLFISQSDGTSIIKIDVTQPMPVSETVASGLAGPTLTVFDGLDLYYGEQNAGKVSKISVSQLAFPDPADACASENAAQRGGAIPTGGMYSGPNVTDNGDGETFSFNAVAAGPGMHPITYTLTSQTIMATIQVVALDDASFSYPASSFCVNAADPTPTISGLAGGTFSSGGGLSINAATGAVDVSASTPGTYTVAYTTAGACPNSSNVSVTVNGLDDASFTYSAATYCASDSDPTPTISGLAGGTFSSGAGLSINASTGAVDVSASTPGAYTVTYTTSGTCPNSSNVNLSINALDDASFSYGAASYCVDAADPTPTITGLSGGTFSSTAGVSLNASTGAIDVSASTPGTYTLTYTTAGTCPNSSNVSVTINALDDASFSYGASSYDIDGTDPTPMVTGQAGGTFTSTPAGLMIDGATGTVDLSESTPNTYTVTYTTAGTCPNSSNVDVTINDVVVPTPGNECSDANDINNLFGQPLNIPQVSGIWDNTNYASVNDPAPDAGCFYNDDPLAHTIWYSFTSDGSTYGIRTVQCSATNDNYITDGDTQMSVYSGDDCGNLTLVVCEEDEDGGGGILNAYVEMLPTDAGATYFIMVDGFSMNVGEFCLEVTNLAPNAITNIGQTNIDISPNPTTGEIQLTNVEADLVQVFDSMGRLVFSKKQPGSSIDISDATAGFYFLKIHAGEEVYSARVVKE